MVGIQWLLLWF